MKFDSTTFLCDAKGCQESLTVSYGPDQPTAAYLELAEAGWRIHRRLTGWQHFCTTHRDASEATS